MVTFQKLSVLNLTPFYLEKMDFPIYKKKNFEKNLHLIKSSFTKFNI